MSTNIFWYAFFVASLETLQGKPVGQNIDQGINSATVLYSPLLKQHLISRDDVFDLVRRLFKY